jgi:multiple sugar transport system substrate-binding protein
MRRTRWIAALAALAVVATACGEAADDAPDTTDTVDETEEPTEDDAEEPADDEAATGDEIDLRWRTRPDNQAEIDVYQSVSDSIDEAWDGVTLEYEPGGTETAAYQDALRTEIAGGTAPDVFWIPGTDIADFANRGLIMDLRDMAEASDAYAGDDAYYEGPMELLTYDPESGESGTALWGLPRDVSTFALYLNLDLIAEAGAPDPRELDAAGEWNWDTFREVGEAVDGLGDEIYGFGMNNWWANPGIWINSAGGGFFNEDRTACALDSDESIQGLEYMVGLYQDGLAVPYGEDSQPPYEAGQVGMQLTGRWSTPAYRQIDGLRVGRREHPRRSRRCGQLDLLGRLRRQRQHRAPGGGLRARHPADGRRDAGPDRRARCQHPVAHRRPGHDRHLPDLHPAGEQPGLHRRAEQLRAGGPAVGG